MFPFKNRSILYPDMVVHKTSLDNIWRSCLHEEEKKKKKANSILYCFKAFVYSLNTFIIKSFCLKMTYFVITYDSIP